MRLEDMTLLVRVAETGSMTLTARQLHLTPAAVSATVRRVEAAMGVRLFERTTRSIHPTDDGRVVIEGCKDVVERWQRALEDVHEATRELQGVVHLSAPADTTYAALAPVVVAMSRAHPRLQVVLHSSDTVQRLHRDAIDMAIRYGSLPDSGLLARKLAQWPVILVASPAYLATRPPPQTPAELAAHRCITLQLSSVPANEWTVFSDAGAETVALRSPLCADGYMARRWAVEGQGIALKSVFDVIDDLEAGRLVRVLPGWATAPMPIHALFPSRRYLPARVRALSDAVASHFAARSARCAAWLATPAG